jgi:hypothetical protein
MRKKRIRCSRIAIWRFFERHNVTDKKACEPPSSCDVPGLLSTRRKVGWIAGCSARAARIRPLARKREAFTDDENGPGVASRLRIPAEAGTDVGRYSFTGYDRMRSWCDSVRDGPWCDSTEAAMTRHDRLFVSEASRVQSRVCFTKILQKG